MHYHCWLNSRNSRKKYNFEKENEQVRHFSENQIIIFTNLCKGVLETESPTLSFSGKHFSNFTNKLLLSNVTGTVMLSQRLTQRLQKCIRRWLIIKLKY